jgi:hypothetical protein
MTRLRLVVAVVLELSAVMQTIRLVAMVGLVCKWRSLARWFITQAAAVVRLAVARQAQAV